MFVSVYNFCYEFVRSGVAPLVMTPNSLSHTHTGNKKSKGKEENDVCMFVSLSALCYEFVRSSVATFVMNRSLSNCLISSESLMISAENKS